MKNKSFAVIGLGRFGASVAENLQDSGYDVLALDQNEENVNEVAQYVTHAIVGDAEDEKLLESLGVGNFDSVIVALGHPSQSSIFVTVMLKQLGAKHIIAKANSELHAKVLYMVGADKVVFPERDMGAKIARSLITQNILDLIELSDEYSIMEVIAPIKWIGKSLKEINVRAKYGTGVMAIKKANDLIVAPPADYIIAENDLLVLIGNQKNIKKICE